MKTIELFVLGDSWMSRHSDPEVTRLFGTDVIPTAYLAAAHSDTVLAAIQQLNPDCTVCVSELSI